MCLQPLCMVAVEEQVFVGIPGVVDGAMGCRITVDDGFTNASLMYYISTQHECNISFFLLSKAKFKVICIKLSYTQLYLSAKGAMKKNYQQTNLPCARCARKWGHGGGGHILTCPPHKQRLRAVVGWPMLLALGIVGLPQIWWWLPSLLSLPKKMVVSR